MRPILCALVCAFGMTYSSACDICGSAASSFSMGLLPNSKHHFIGLRYTMKSFESKDLHLSNGSSSYEYFTTSELIGRYKLNKRIQLLASVPYIYNSRKDNSSVQSLMGLGDITIIGNYVFIDNTDSLSKRIKQSGTFGIGVKLPSGMYQKPGFMELNMLPGTGSIDMSLNFNYALQKGSYGTQNESSFTLKTQNKYLYRFGNSISFSQLVFYRWVLNENTKIIPQMGLNFNHNWKDIKNGKKSEETYNGGNILNGQFNIFVLFKNWGFSTQLFVPIYQRLNEGYVVQHNSFRCSINYFISKNKRV